MSTTKAPENLIRTLRSGARFLLTSHANPDGDAIGSCIGLARVLRSLGKGAVIWNRDETPEIYHALPGSGRIHVGEEPPTGFPEAFDAAVILECPSLDRTGLAERLGELPILNIDHHLGNEHYGKVNWVDTGAPALGEMIHRLAQTLNASIDEPTATTLFLTLVTDTGGFRFANAGETAFTAAAALVRAGARPQEVARWLYESRPLASVKLLGEILASLELHHDGRIATVLLTPEMLERSGATNRDAEGLIDTPRSIAGVDAVALLRQIGEAGCKVSLRSRGDIDVQTVARRHEGGGHRNAAGYSIDGLPADLRQSVADELAAALEPPS